MPDIYRQIEELLDYTNYEAMLEHMAFLESQLHGISTMDLPF